MKTIFKTLLLLVCISASVETSAAFNPDQVYYPHVVYNAERFNDSSPYYKMWFQTTAGVGLASSDDGQNWTEQAISGIPATAVQPFVVYDPNGFGGQPYTYRIWYRDTSIGSNQISSLKTAVSANGINWTSTESISQSNSSNLVTGQPKSYFYHIYGPGYILYNPAAPSNLNGPLEYPYVMYYTTASEGSVCEGSVQQIALAYSTNGINWIAYSTPVLIPSGNSEEWNGRYYYKPLWVTRSSDRYLMYFNCSKSQPIPLTGDETDHGICMATSYDGIKWNVANENEYRAPEGVTWKLAVKFSHNSP